LIKRDVVSRQGAKSRKDRKAGSPIEGQNFPVISLAAAPDKPVAGVR
jgi:hypothetical protein